MQQESIQNDEVFMTSSTKLATALLALGNTLRRPPCTRQVRRDGKTIVTFLFNPTTEGAVDSCGKLAVRWMELEGQDPGDQTPADLQNRLTWLAELREEGDPVALAYANSGWRDIALSIAKATPRMVEVQGRDSIGFVREDATPEDIRKIERHL
jgi:hypothetical protein